MGKKLKICIGIVVIITGVMIILYIKGAPKSEYCVEKENFDTVEKAWFSLQTAFKNNDVSLYEKCVGKKLSKKVKDLSSNFVECEIIKIEIYGRNNQFACVMYKPIKCKLSPTQEKVLEERGYLWTSYFERINDRWVYTPESFYSHMKEMLDYLARKILRSGICSSSLILVYKKSRDFYTSSQLYKFS